VEKIKNRQKKQKFVAQKKKKKKKKKMQARQASSHTASPSMRPRFIYVVVLCVVLFYFAMNARLHFQCHSRLRETEAVLGARVSELEMRLAQAERAARLAKSDKTAPSATGPSATGQFSTAQSATGQSATSQPAAALNPAPPVQPNSLSPVVEKPIRPNDDPAPTVSIVKTDTKLPALSTGV
jgi:hypothetical protein